MQFVVPYDQLAVNPPGPWQNANPSAGIQGSIPNADVFPAVQNEILNAIQDGGLAPSGADFAQLLRSIRSGKMWTFADTSEAVNTIVVTPRTAHTALTIGLPFRVFPAFTNTSTTVTLDVGTTLSAAIRKRDQTAPAVGDIVAGVPLDIAFDGTFFRIVNFVVSDVLALVTTQSTNETVVNNIVSRVPPYPTGFKAFSVGGAISFIVPDGVYKLFVELLGSGAGGSSGLVYPGRAGGAGGSGAYTRGEMDVTPGQVITGYVGVGGAGAPSSGNYGSSGQTTTFGGWTAPGAQVFTSAPNVLSTGQPGGVAGTGGLENYAGAIGGDGADGGTLGGNGAGTPYGTGGRAGVPAGFPGVAYGSGGGGTYSGVNGFTPTTGGNGADGAVVIRWFEVA